MTKVERSAKNFEVKFVGGEEGLEKFVALAEQGQSVDELPGGVEHFARQLGNPGEFGQHILAKAKLPKPFESIEVRLRQSRTYVGETKHTGDSGHHIGYTLEAYVRGSGHTRLTLDPSSAIGSGYEFFGSQSKDDKDKTPLKPGEVRCDSYFARSKRMPLFNILILTRYFTREEGDTIVLEAPLFNHRALGESQEDYEKERQGFLSGKVEIPAGSYIPETVRAINRDGVRAMVEGFVDVLARTVNSVYKSAGRTPPNQTLYLSVANQKADASAGGR